MKMKRSTLGFSILAASAAFVFSCSPKKVDPPLADTEVQSSIYASFANYVVSDIEMACSFMAENNYGTSNMFYGEYPGSSSGTSGTVVVTRDTTQNPANGNEDQMSMSWNNSKCLDGNFRDGSIFLYVPQISNQRYAHEALFQGRITFSTYKINGWTIELFNDAAPIYIYSTLKVGKYSNATTNLTWRVAGKLKMTHPSDPNKNMVWDGELFKTLKNTANPLVFPVSQKGAITWSLAIIGYDGKVNGSGPQIDEEGKVTPNVAYTMKIESPQQLIRDFQCAPDQVTGVTFTIQPGVVVKRGSEHHPFKAGVASFTVGSGYPRQIYYGNEGDPLLAAQCDNVGEVMIKGISYRINFFQ